MFSAKWKSILVLAAMAALPDAAIGHAADVVSPEVFGKGPSVGETGKVAPSKGGPSTVDLEPAAPMPDRKERPGELGSPRFPYLGPSHDLCRQPSGEVVRRARCRTGEISTDPSALHLCASRNGSLGVRGGPCPNGAEVVDLRRVNRASPASFFPQLATTSAFELLAPLPAPEFEASPAVRPEICRTRGARVTFRRICPSGESPLHPTGLVACAKSSGALVLAGLGCPKGETPIALRDLRGVGPEPIGIGPLVGLFPSLADLAADYPQGPGA